MRWARDDDPRELPDDDDPPSGAARVARWAGLAIAAVVCVILAIGLWDLGWIIAWRWYDPGETAFMRAERERLEAAHSRVRITQDWEPYARISITLKRAVIASEDARFLEHDGVDWEAVEKAYENNQKSGARRLHGGSTISQQVAKNLFLSGSRTYLRKGEELAITYMIEMVWSKRRILEVYLNIAEWGEGLFGAEAAARYYYGVPAAQLAPEQAARLAAFLPSPVRYGKIRTGGYLDARTDEILRWMNDSQVP